MDDSWGFAHFRPAVFDNLDKMDPHVRLDQHNAQPPVAFPSFYEFLRVRSASNLTWRINSEPGGYAPLSFLLCIFLVSC